MENQRSKSLLSADSINGTTVENSTGENIGDIKDLMINTNSGEVEYAVLSVNTGFLNLGSKYFAIPLQAMTFDKSREKVLVDISKDRLENSPGFDKDNWPDGAQNEFVSSVYDYYEIDRSQRYAAAGMQDGANPAMKDKSIH